MGFLLRQLQEGEDLSLPHSRPMPVIGKAAMNCEFIDLVFLRPRSPKDLSSFLQSLPSGFWMARVEAFLCATKRARTLIKKEKCQLKPRRRDRIKLAV